MKLSADLAEALKSLSNTGDEVFAAVVKSVDKSNSTCTVEESDDEVIDVRLKASSNNGKGMKVFPAIDSVVLVQRLGVKGDELFVVMYSEVEEVLYEVDTCSLKVNASGFEIKKGSDTLSKVIDDLCSEMKAIKVPTNSGLSGTPINEPAITAIQNRATDLLK